MRKTYFFIGLCILCILGYSFFQYDTQKDLFQTQDSAPTPLTIWVQESFRGTETYFNYIKDTYKSLYPNRAITINVLKGNDTRVYSYITTQILNDNVPDVVFLSLENQIRFTIEHRLIDLTDYINNYEDSYFLPSIIENGAYNDGHYGITYFLDPEILVYRKDLLDESVSLFPESLDSFSDFDDTLTHIDHISSQMNLNKCTFSIPVLTNNAQFISSIIGNDSLELYKNRDCLERLKTMHDAYQPALYRYDKISSHPFFFGDCLVSIEPLSSIYEEFTRDDNIQNSTEIYSVDTSNYHFSYSLNHYAGITSLSNMKSEAYDFLDLFFSESEISNRYRLYNVPIICYPLKEQFISDNNFPNAKIWNYLEYAYHYPITEQTLSDIEKLDNAYASYLHPKK